MLSLVHSLKNIYSLNQFCDNFHFNSTTFFIWLLQEKISEFWLLCDSLSDIIFVLDVAVQLRTGYLEQGLMVRKPKFN